MPIIHMGDNNAKTFPEGAYCPLEQPGSFVLVLYSTHHGLCLFEREMNGYDDSDFYMTVWNPETKSSEEIMFATTRGWTYPCMGSSVDATPEVRAEYNAWSTARARRNRVQFRWNERKRIREIAAQYKIPTFAVKRLMKMSDNCYERCMRLLATKKFRSTFRESLANRLRNWCHEKEPKFSSPFSDAQWLYLV